MNAYGANLTRSLLETLSTNQNIAIFLDSCHHHGYAGGQYFTHIKDDNHTPVIDVFDRWVADFVEAQGPVFRLAGKLHHLRNVSVESELVLLSLHHNTVKSLGHQNMKVFDQKHRYPCSACCGKKKSR